MRKIRLSSHAIDRWRERVGLRWSTGKICDYIYNRFLPRLHKGIQPHVLDGQLYYLFNLGKLNGKEVYVVLSPEHEGLWSGWTGVTFLTDDVIDDFEEYLKWLYGRRDESGETVSE